MCGLPSLIMADEEFVQGGCYQEDPLGKGIGVLDPPRGGPRIPKKKDLNMMDKDGKKNNGPAACGAFCKGYKYFHLSAKDRCFCGNNINGPLKKVPETDCKYDCPGDNTKKCGAHYRLNLYKVEEFVEGGCYQEDPWGKRVGVLDPPKGSRIPKKKDLNMMDKDGKKNNSPAACNTFCKGYKYFHLSAKDRCFCGNNLNGPLKKVPETDCKYNCPGDETKKCGEHYKLNLYTVKED